MTIPTELEEREATKESRERAGERLRADLTGLPPTQSPDKADPDGLFEHDPDGFFEDAPTPAGPGPNRLAPDSAFQLAYADTPRGREQSRERERVHVGEASQTAAQHGVDTFARTMGAGQPADAEYDEHGDLIPDAPAPLERSAMAEREPRAAQTGEVLGSLPAYAVAGRGVGALVPEVEGAGLGARALRVGASALRGGLENAAVQVPQGEDPIDALVVGTMFGGLPSAVIETGGALIGGGARALRPHAAEASARNSGARIEDLPQIRRRLGSVEEYSDALRRLRASGRIPADATPEQARAVADQLLGQSPGRAQPIMRAETQGAVQANPVVAERAASPDLAEQDQAARLTDLINQHHDQVATARAEPEQPYVDQPPERHMRDTTNHRILPPEERAARGAEKEAARGRRAAGTAPQGRRGRVDPLGGTVMMPTQIAEAPGVAPRRNLNIPEGHPKYIPPPSEEQITQLGERTRQRAETRAAQAAAPRPSDMSPLTRALERRGGDIDEAAREAINSLVEGRSGLTEQPLREYQASDELRRIGERNAGRGGAIPHVIPEQNLMSTRGIVGRAASRGINHVVGSDFVNDLLERVVKRGVREQPQGHTPARHALSAVLTAYHESGDRRGRAEHHRQVETDPHYRALTRRKSSE